MLFSFPAEQQLFKHFIQIIDRDCHLAKINTVQLISLDQFHQVMIYISVFKM